MKNKYEKYDYNEYPKILDPNDYWGQVRRTVDGRPVGEDQIAMIVDAIQEGLQLTKNDVLLDIACGNGALTSRLFDRFDSGVGIDSSQYLIEIASANFSKPGFNYLNDSVEQYFQKKTVDHYFTKALCYGSFSFFDTVTVDEFFESLTRKFKKIETIYIGNVPDKDRAKNFFKNGHFDDALLNECRSQIGVWRSKYEWEKLADEYGWILEVKNMPEEYYAAHYRFDVILKRD